MSTNISSASITAYGSNQTTTRRFGDRYDDFLNVKDYGAVGDGVTDDAAAIQACFDAAFGTFASPHGNGGQNKAVYFPAGIYTVSKPVGPADVWGGKIFGDGMNQSYLQFTGASPFIWSTFNANSSGSNLYVDKPSTAATDGVFNGYVPLAGILSGTGVPANTQILSQTSGSTGSSGVYVTSVLGTTVAQVTNSSNNTLTVSWIGCALSADRMNFTAVSDMSFSATADSSSGQNYSISLMIWADGRGTSAHGNNFVNCATAGSNQGVTVVRLPYGAAMSENTFTNCNLSSHSLYGLRIFGQNSLNMNLYGGKINNCGEGISIGTGSVDVVSGVSFSGNTWDIVQGNAIPMHIIGCHTDSNQFFKFNGGPPTHILNCTHAVNGSTQTFVASVGSGNCVIEGCDVEDAVIASSIAASGIFWLRGNNWHGRTISEYVGTNTSQLMQWNDPAVGTPPLPTVSALSTGPGSNTFKGLKTVVRNSSNSAANSSNYGTTVVDAKQTLASISSGSPAVFTGAANHGLVENDAVMLATTGTLPGPFTTTGQYHVISAGLTSSQFQLSSATGGTAINATSTGTGTHSCTNPSANTASVMFDGINWIMI